MPRLSPLRRIGIWPGTALEALGVGIGFLLLQVSGIAGAAQNVAAAVALLFASWVCLWLFSHCLAHFLVGKLLGINFRFCFVGRSSLRKLDLPVVTSVAKRLPLLGIKVDRPSLERVSPRRRAAMFASGAVASMALPWACVIYAALYLPSWIAALFGILSLGNTLFTAFFSSKVGDLRKAREAMEKDLQPLHEPNRCESFAFILCQSPKQARLL